MKWLKKSYPFDMKLKNKLQISIGCGIFVFLFLFSFKPFQLYLLPSEHILLKIAGYGIITIIAVFFCIYILPLIFKNYFAEEKWNIGREIILILAIILSICTLNATYTKLFVVNYNVSLLNILFYFIATLIIAVFPVTFIILIEQNRFLRQNLKNAQEINNEITELENLKKKTLILK